METVFITIHDLSLDARIRYCSDSIEDILGYLPHDVTGKSCWEYFHPDEIPFARSIHGRGVSLDKAAVLNYCRIKHKDGTWVTCECVFTVVHDVLVASTAVYRQGPKARKRALEGAGIRRIFSSSPRDPRYHMLSFLSNKFYQDPSAHLPEPRAALFLNRFTRTSTIMYATDGLSAILGLEPSELIGKSFYYCIEENCLQDAVKCLESAKANDSIAYLRFWYRNPLQDEDSPHAESVRALDESEEDDDGGVPLTTGVSSGSSVSMTNASTPRPTEEAPHLTGTQAAALTGAERTLHVDEATQSPAAPPQVGSETAPAGGNVGTQRLSSGNHTDPQAQAHDGVFGGPESGRSSTAQTLQEDLQPERLELEAVVSCSSDGLVVILRRARPLVPHTLGATEAPYYANGLFASPWAPEPVIPPTMAQGVESPSVASPTATESSESGFMAAIRDVAVFAWSLTGINGSLTQYARGQASGEALPPGGLPVWDPDAKTDPDMDRLFNGFLGSVHRPFEGMGEPTPGKEDEVGSSEDEVVWKRVPTIPPWRRPKRRGDDAFGTDEFEGGDGENRDGGRKKAAKSHSGSGSTGGAGSGPTSGSDSKAWSTSATDQSDGAA
ncbi:hypothetical protein A1O3_07087 [Capronia epimyces CBS 606.96]|uniref:PAS domain-containing protein n=1 Tax=Capronia epimyces CBS 606.96 TaxID=1182542 RepID=W9XKR7_9EURO|nr:uncharacterized protein A1O3_07087 [Capronia epimyces CBS 606.96]EXJ80803.1 hypothetical protein A1O3_07087 [Capronia epimyces CBS 606.96]